MADDRSSGMSEALRLTRAGRLEEAFAAMQGSLGSPSTGLPATHGFSSPLGGASSARGIGGLLGRLRGALPATTGAGLPGDLRGLLANLPSGGRAGGRAA